MSPVPNVGLDSGIGTTTKSPFCTVSGFSTSRKSGTAPSGWPEVTGESAFASSAKTGGTHINTDANRQSAGLPFISNDFIDEKTRLYIKLSLAISNARRNTTCKLRSESSRSCSYSVLRKRLRYSATLNLN